MYEILLSGKFKRDVKRCKKQHKPFDKFKVITDLLILGDPLPEKNRDHNLSGNWSGYRECHLEPDWLLIYRVNEETKTIEYARMGSHSDLF